MFSLILILAIFALTLHRLSQTESDIEPLSQKLSLSLQKLWNIAHSGLRENKFLRAEKALLTILKIDQTNAAAYNRLGILYAKQKEYKDAIDCFEIASSLEPSPSSLHNLGLIYYETENFEKAAAAFEHALDLDEKLASRHIAYAKVLEKLNDTKAMLTELERAVELEPNPESYQLLAKAYEATGHSDEAEDIRNKIRTLIIPSSKRKRIARPKQSVI